MQQPPQILDFQRQNSLNVEARRQDVIKDIKAIVDKKTAEFFMTVWDGANPVPDWIITVFKKAIMATPAKDVQVLMRAIRGIASKKHSELTIDEIGIICQYVGAAVPSSYAESYEELVAVRLPIEALMYEQTQKVERHSENMKREKDAYADMYDKQTWIRKTAAPVKQ